jgi:hypothetical protein
MAFINPKHLYAADRRFAFDFDQDAGEEAGSMPTALDLAQSKGPRPTPRPPATPAPVASAPALPDMRPPVRPGPVSRVTAALDTHTPLSRIGAEPEPDLRDYRHRPIEDALDFRRDQYVRQGGTTDEAGNFTPKKPSLMRRIGDAALNTFLAMGQLHQANPNNGLGNLGGAITAGVISGRDPVRARELRFNALERPQIEAGENRQAQRQARFLGAMKTQLDLEKNRAEIERSKAETERIRAVIRNPPRSPAQLKLGRDRQTGGLRYFDPLDQAQAAQYEPYEFAQQRQRQPQYRLGRHVDTDEVDYYDISDPDQAAYFEPYQMPRPESGRTSEQRRGAAGQLNQINKLKREASKAWEDWGNTTDPDKKRKAAAKAGAAQGAYNDAVRVLGETFPDDFETGGFAEQNGNQGWAYYKPREGAQAGATNRSSTPTSARGSKGLAPAGFVDHVARTLNISPEEARRRVEADGYRVR